MSHWIRRRRSFDLKRLSNFLSLHHLHTWALPSPLSLMCTWLTPDAHLSVQSRRPHPPNLTTHRLQKSKHRCHGNERCITRAASAIATATTHLCSQDARSHDNSYKKRKKKKVVQSSEVCSAVLFLAWSETLTWEQLYALKGGWTK